MKQTNERLILDFVSSKKGYLRSPVYTNQRERLLWECEKGHQWKACWDSIKHTGSWCPTCAGKTKPTLAEINLFAQGKDGCLLSSEYKNNKTSLLWKCNICLIQWKACWNSIKHQNTWCPNCSNLYINEAKCIQLAQKILNIPLNKKRIYYNLSNNRDYLEFDGYNEEHKIAVEYNGRQHYKQNNLFHKTEQAFIDQQTRDKRKQEYCKTHDIQLIEIPYTKNKNMELYLTETLLPINSIIFSQRKHKMTKKELGICIAGRSSVSQTEAARMIDEVVSAIREQLEQNQEVTIRGFGTFKPITSAPRSGRNLRTQERVIIPAKTRVKFKSYMEEKEVV